MNSSAPNAPWENLLDGRFKSQHPRRTLWDLFADQRGRVFGATAFYIIKQTPASLMPLAVGMIVDALTAGGPGAFRKILFIAAGYFLLLLQNPFVHTSFVRLMSGALRHMQFNLRSALVERLQQLSITFYEEKQSSALQTKLLRDVDAIDDLCRHLMHTGRNGLLSVFIHRHPTISCGSAVGHVGRFGHRVAMVKSVYRSIKKKCPHFPIDLCPLP